MIAVLRQIDRKRMIPIDRAVIVVGRSAECDVVITTSQKISRRHCCLVQSDKCYFVRDLGSMNGVTLNGIRINREAEMKAGDRICIGDVEFQLFTNVKVESKKQLRTDGVTEEDMASQEIRPSSLVNQEETHAEMEGLEVEEEYEIMDDVIPLDPSVPLCSPTNELEASDEFMIDESGVEGSGADESKPS